MAALSRLALLSPGRPDFGPFFLDRFEVTNQEFQHFLRKRLVALASARALGEEEELPVSGVTPLQAMSYARWRGMRLPTLAEWEWAVGSRGGERSALPWGKVFDSSRLDHLKCNTAELGLGRPTAVGTFELGATTDALGRRIYDLVGNVAEWVRLPPEYAVEGVEELRSQSGLSSPPRAWRAFPLERHEEDPVRLAFVLSTLEALHFHHQLAMAERAAAGRLAGLLAWLGQLLAPLFAEDFGEFYQASPFTTLDAIRFGFGLTTTEAALFHHQVELARLACGPYFPAGLPVLASILVPPPTVDPGAQLLVALKWLQVDTLREWWENLDSEEAAWFHHSVDLARRAVQPWFPPAVDGIARLLLPWSGWDGLFHQRFQVSSAQALEFRSHVQMAERALGSWAGLGLEAIAADLVPLGLADRELFQRPWGWAGWSHASAMEWAKSPVPDRISSRKGYQEASSTVGFRCAAWPADLLAWLASREGPPLTGADGRTVALFLAEHRTWLRAALTALPGPGTEEWRLRWIQGWLE